MRKALAVVVCCFILATGYIAYVIAERQNALQKFARYNDSWAVSQTVGEYVRFESLLAEYALGIEGIDKDELRLRLDIVLGRMNSLREGSLAAFIDASRTCARSLEKSTSSLETSTKGWKT